MEKRLRNGVIVLASLAVALLVGYRWGQKTQKKVEGIKNELDLTLMWKVKDKLEEVFLEKEKIKDKEMVYGAIKGMVESLDDPYTAFLPPKENKNSNEDLQGEFSGVGIQLGYKDKTLAVMSPLPKTPAERAGILAGDLILKIVDKRKAVDKDTAGISLEEAVDLIRGEKGTEVTLKIFREGKKEAFDVVLKRDNIVVPSIEWEFKEKQGKRIAWIRLYKFTERLYQEWPTVVEEINKKNDGIVLDLRNNPGGFLQGSVVVASDFISDGLIVEQMSTDGKSEKYFVDKSRRKLLGDKLVVLINGGSASAAEILAGALKSYQRGKLVGEKTFGKGTVQMPENFADGSGLHVTIAKWLLPDGKNIHKVGVDPDVEIENDPELKDKDGKTVDKQLEKAIELVLL